MPDVNALKEFAGIFFPKQTRVTNFNDVVNRLRTTNQPVGFLKTHYPNLNTVNADIRSAVSGRWHGFIKRLGWQKGLGKMFRNPWVRGVGLTMGIGTLAGTWSIGKALMSSIRYTHRSQAVQQGIGYGPGMITWSKKRGMPAGHNATQDLTESLHRMRHSSIV
jgi:hypothetical protein